MAMEREGVRPEIGDYIDGVSGRPQPGGLLPAPEPSASRVINSERCLGC